MYKKNYTTAKWLVPPPLIICPDKPVGVQSTVSYRYSDSVLVPRYQVLLTVKGVPAMYLFNQRGVHLYRESRAARAVP